MSNVLDAAQTSTFVPSKLGLTDLIIQHRLAKIGYSYNCPKSAFMRMYEVNAAEIFHSVISTFLSGQSLERDQH